MRLHFGLPSALLVLVLAGCGAGATSGGGVGSNRISTAMLRQADTDGINAYEMIQRHRPQWLRAARGSTSFGAAAGGTAGPATAKVMLNGTPFGEIDDLRGIDVTSVDHLEYISAADATTRFGTGYTGGAILVNTR